MFVVRLDPMSMARAERVVAEVWRVLEEYHIASPQLAVEARMGNFLDMHLTFDSIADAALVRHALLGLQPTVSSEMPLGSGYLRPN